MKIILRDLNSLLAGLEPFVAEYLEETPFRPFSELRIETAASSSCTVVVVRSKAINHLHGRGLDRRTVYQSIPIYFEARVVHIWLMTSALALNAGKCSASFHDVSNGLEASE